MIKLMKASAGAGKTYNLAKTYIRILLQKKDDRFAYRKVLAVTFTNKATAEMKTRILNELYRLAQNPGTSPYVRDFVPSVVPTVRELGEVAGKVLSNILHDYSAFAVSTIDKFFQQTLKAFSREIGQFASYQVELDRDSLVAESVDRLLDSVTENDRVLLAWLKSNVLEQIENGGRYSVDANLMSVAKRIMSVERQDVLAANGMKADEMFTKERLSEIRKRCRQVITGFEQSVKCSAEQVLDALDSVGVNPADSNRGFLKALYAYSEDVLGGVEKPTAAFLAKASEPEQWFSKTKAKVYFPKVDGLLQGPLETFVHLFGTDFAVYNTARIIDGQLFGMGVACELSAIFREVMKERNVLCLDDSNTILKNIIDGSDAPFIYEKLGVRFENFLLDEFQDTSRVQWDNFRPLLENSDASGNENLIVGDVKQSIYRWRGSDWKLFNEDVRKGFPNIVEENLPSNFRSLKNIVEFNNDFFTVLSKNLDTLTQGKVSDVYSNVWQSVGRQDVEGGSVEVSFCDKDQEVEEVVKAVREVRDRGAGPGDIAVLVRSNSTGERIAVALIEDGQPVITDDSLRVKASVAVRRLYALLSYVDNPVDSVSAYMVASLDISIPQNCHSLIDLAENLYRQLVASADAETKEFYGGEVLHVQSFMDYLQDYVSREGNDLHGFLRYWDDENPSISSPATGNSIRVMTIHKSKGLDFPYVIIPFVENITLFKQTNVWCRPQLEGTALDGQADGVYDVTLSSKSTDTLFASDYEAERFLQIVDNINVLYVAMTRASKGMYLIAASPSEKSIDEMTDMAACLYRYLNIDLRTSDSSLEARTGCQVEADGQKYRIGQPYVFPETGDGATAVSGPAMTYPSFPLNPGEGEADVDVRERGRLKFSSDAVDFFSKEGETGIAASSRIKGVILHNILAGVVVRNDVDKAVDEAVHAGVITVCEADGIRKLLRESIASVADRGWFPERREQVMNEVSLIDTDGSLSRPDRVVLDGDRLYIIDYKFGQEENRYKRQVGAYADLFRRMGYGNVTSYLWYVLENKIVEV